MKYFKYAFCLLPLTLLLGCFNMSSSYPPPGRNTIELFGDGRFEIFTGKNEGVRYYCLYDRKDGEEGQVEGNILNYKEINTCVYLIGTTGSDGIDEEENKSKKIYYTKVNYESGEIVQNIDLSLFVEDDIKVFNDLINSKSTFDDK